MEETQSFHLIGNMAIKKIRCHHVDGQSVIYWEDVKHFFPGVMYVKNGDVGISFMRDSNGNR